MMPAESGPVFFFSSRRRHTRFDCDWSSDVCSSDLKLPWRGDGFHLFAALLDKRPSPMNSYIDFKGFELISNSPERYLRADAKSAETSPIKGTRPRGNTPDEDAALMKELLSSEKE